MADEETIDKNAEQILKDSTVPEPFEINPRIESITDVVFRNVVETHVELTFISDHKAYVLIYINSAIIMALTTLLLPGLADVPTLIVPTAIMYLVCLASLAFAILSVRPKLGSGRTSREEILSRKSNLLFFGNFHKMSLDEYEWGVRKMFKEDDFLFLSMVRDIFFLGKSLGTKYSAVRTGYTIFIAGMILSVAAFMISIICFTDFSKLF